MAYIHFSNNPLGKNTGDCVIRAISVAENLSWDEVFWKLAQKAYEMGDVLTSNSVWGALLKDLGYVRGVIPNSCPDCYSVREFANEHPQGIYVLGTGTHAVAVVNGDYIDAWQSGNETPIYYFRKEI